MVCPQCGAPISPTDIQDVFYCSYCGAKIEREKLRIEVSGRVSVNGIADESVTLDRAYILLEDGYFTDANRYFEKAIDINPRSSKAYFGKMMATNRYRNTNELIEQCEKSLNNNGLFQKALRFANKNEYDELIKIRTAIDKRHYEKINRLRQDMNDISEEIVGVEEESEAVGFSLSKYKISKTVIIILFIVAAFWFFGGIAVLTAQSDIGNIILAFFLFLAPSIAAFIGLGIWLKRINRKKAEKEKLEQKKEQLWDEVGVKRIQIEAENDLWNS